jgi:pentapeptide MXKDX repeat protein
MHFLLREIMNKHAIGILASLALTVAAANAQTSTTISGKIVDLATYVTHDHNMDAMKGHAMKDDAMHGDAMHGDAMQGDATHGDAMQGDAMHTDAMHADAMHADAMHADTMHGSSTCPASLGLVTSAGRVYLLATQAGSAQTQTLCKEIGKTVSVAGTVFSQGGMSALLVK